MNHRQHDEDKRLSKRMSKILRHAPDAYGIKLDPADGSCQVEVLLAALRRDAYWSKLELDDIERVVRESDKQRYEIREGRIRARYGHSFTRVDYEKAAPQAILYHGTNLIAAPAIIASGIDSMGRQYVHLSEGLEFARLAGERRGKLVIIEVDTAKAADLGISFYYAGNEVWLADFIPASCCSIKAGGI